MTLRHAAALALVYWILFLDTSPDRHGFDEWSGNFSSKQKCEDALKREQTHWYDGSPEQPNPDEPNIHVHGKHSFWVRRLPGFCESSEVFESPASGWYVIVPPDRCEDRTRDDIDICAKVPNSDAPLSQWLPTWPNYRTVEECEKVLDMNRNTLILNAADRQLEKAELAAERCVRSDAIHGK